MRSGKKQAWRTIHWLLWSFILLLLFDGVLRKWVLPGLSDVLLLSRLPVVAAIYLLALQYNWFPRSPLVFAVFFLAVSSAILGYILHGSVFAIVYGVSSNFFFIPLIYIIPKIWDRSDVSQVGRFLLYVSIPMTVLILLQFYAPQSAWVNLSVGGTEGAGFSGALGRYRPPGTFSFITGVAQFYTLMFSFFVGYYLNRGSIRLPKSVLLACGICLPLAIFASISRLLAVGVVLTTVLCFMAIMYNGRRTPSAFKVIGVLAIFVFLAAQLPYFSDTTDAFFARWERSTGEDKGGVREAIIMRTIDDFTRPFKSLDTTPWMGFGIGAGTQVGAKLIRGERGFMLAEGEWGRVLGELGVLMGIGFLLIRCRIVYQMGALSLRQAARGNFLPWLMFSASFMLVLNGQWGQQTTLGFAVLGAGLCFASCRAPASVTTQNKSVDEARAKESK